LHRFGDRPQGNAALVKGDCGDDDHHDRRAYQ
jgi:hypothetical protein